MSTNKIKIRKLILYQILILVISISIIASFVLLLQPVQAAPAAPIKVSNTDENRPQPYAYNTGNFEMVAAVKTWDGDAGDGLWSSPTNWDNDTLPAVDDSVLLDDPLPTSITMDMDVTIEDLTISGPSVSLSPGGATSLDLVNYSQSNGTFTPPASMSVAGEFDHNGGTFIHNNGTVTFDGGTTQISSGITMFYNLIVESGSTVQLATASDFGFAGTFTLNGGFDATTNSPTTLRLGGSGTKTLRDGIQLDYLIINSTATLSAPSTINLSGGWTNSGGFIHNNGTITFNCTSGQIFSGTTLFYNVTVESGCPMNLAANSDFGYAGTFTLNGTFNATGTPPTTVRLAYSGTQSLPAGASSLYHLVVNSGATLVDLSNITVSGVLTNNGALQKTSDVNGSVDVDFFNTGGYGGLTLNANGSDLGQTTVTIKGNHDCTDVAGETVKRCFNIAPANTTSRNATISFYFASSELSGNTCATLDAYHWNGSGWDLESTAARNCSTEPYMVQSSGVSDFSPFVLKSDTGPTTIELTNFTAQTDPSDLLVDFLSRNVLLIIGVITALTLLLCGFLWLYRPLMQKK